MTATCLGKYKLYRQFAHFSSIFMDPSSVIPKMHMLESLNGGMAERVEGGTGRTRDRYTITSTIWRCHNYRNISNDVDTLRCMMKQHFVHIAPSNPATVSSKVSYENTCSYTSSGNSTYHPRLVTQLWIHFKMSHLSTWRCIIQG